MRLPHFFLFPHFRFLQLGDDKVGNTPSFQARHVTICYFLMLEDLLTIENDWETEEEFSEYVSTLNDLSYEDKAAQKGSSLTSLDMLGNH